MNALSPDPEAEGGARAREFAAFLSDHQLRTFVERGPAWLLDHLTPAQDVLLPDPPYDEDDDSTMHDDWCTAFWQTLEGMWDYRDARVDLDDTLDHVEFHFHYEQEPDGLSDDDLARLCADILFDWMVAGNDVGENVTITRARTD